MTDLLLDPSEPYVAGDGVVDVSEAIIRPAYIIAIPRSQAYYWSEVWQSGEHETLLALQDGKGIRFASGEQLSAWLLSEDDDSDEETS
jgi:hypothetical protein